MDRREIKRLIKFFRSQKNIIIKKKNDFFSIILIYDSFKHEV